MKSVATMKALGSLNSCCTIHLTSAQGMGLGAQFHSSLIHSVAPFIAEFDGLSDQPFFPAKNSAKARMSAG
jgi:hypothetical protein